LDGSVALVRPLTAFVVGQSISIRHGAVGHLN
jgi:hypothetical protein